MNRPSISTVIAIDPAMTNSGVCIYDPKKDKIYSITSMRLWEVFELIRSRQDALFLIENSNLIKGNWHGKTARGQVGKNKGISQNIVDFARAHEKTVEELIPKGYSKVYPTHKSFVEETGCKIKSNKDNRAAAAMIYRNKLLIKSYL